MEGNPCSVRLIWRGACNQATYPGTTWPWFSDAADYTNPLSSTIWQWMNIIGPTSTGWTRDVWECFPLLRVNSYGDGLTWNPCATWDVGSGSGTKAIAAMNWLYGTGPHTFSAAA
jgi:hypothetical protein